MGLYIILQVSTILAGCPMCIYSRLRDYHQLPLRGVSILKTNSNTLICPALKKYGIIYFTMVIIEFTELIITTVAEQAWINQSVPKYNILPVAANSLGAF